MNADRTAAIASRIWKQMIRDHRSMALIIVAPIIIMSLVGFSLAGETQLLNRLAPSLLGVFALFFTFLLTGVSFLRERSHGTLERLRTTPVSRADLLGGYLLGFMPFSVLQSTILLGYTIVVLPVSYQGEVLQVFAVLLVLTIVAVSLGILVSTFAHTEFQIVQFIPVIIVPQVFLTGVIVPVETMPWLLAQISHFLPLTYAVDALVGIMVSGATLADFRQEIVILGAFGGVFLFAAGMTVRRS